MFRVALLFLVLAVPALAAPPVPTGGVTIVAAETVYAGVARAIAPDGTRITALIANPAQDPHLFEAGPDAARWLSRADIVIYNGAGYDPWMRDLLVATASGRLREVINVADLVHAGAGANPHIWYDPQTGLALATFLAARLSALEPQRAAQIDANLAAFRASLAGLRKAMDDLRTRHPRVRVAATEPVFGPMLAALGYQSLDPGLELAVQNNVEPAAAGYGGLLDALRAHQAAALIVNTQAETDLTRRLMAVARQSHVPIVSVTETEPANMTYAAWLSREVAALGAALDQPR